MMKPSFRLIAIIAGLFSGYVQAAHYLVVDATSPVAEDIVYRSAFFYQRSGESEKGLSVLSAAPRSGSASINAYRDMLAGYLSVRLGYHEDAERLLANLNDPQLFANYNDQVLYALARAYLGQGRCDKVLSTLQRAQGFSAEVNSHVMYIKVSCMLQQQSQDATVISQAESVINDALMTKPVGNSGNKWYAYAYFNVASASAGTFRNYIDADRLYNEALKYIDDSAEALALKERTLLNLGLVNYHDNRFDYAAQYFAQMPVDGLWADVSLLAYGWAALNTYKPDMAIESWRQLVNLPYKSMSVYEGYMAIPSAFEKANSYGDALAAYDEALLEFNKAVADIDQATKTLTVQKVHEHAILYGQKDQQATANALPAVLARIYTEDSQRQLVNHINDLETYKKRLAAYEQRLNKLNANGGKSALLARIAALHQQASKLQSNVEAQLRAQTLAVLDEQRKRIMQYTLDARVTNVRLQEEFFQRGGRRLWR